MGIIIYGSKDPNNRVLGPKYYIINGIWALKPYSLGPWTLRVSLNPKLRGSWWNPVIGVRRREYTAWEALTRVVTRRCRSSGLRLCGGFNFPKGPCRYMVYT